MTDQNDAPDEEELIENLSVIQKEISGDKQRLDSLLRKGTLNQPGALAGELVQTLYPALADSIDVIAQLLSNHSEGVMGLEDAVYQQNTKAMQILVAALVDKGSLEQETATKVIEILGSDDQSPESFLTTADSELVLRELRAYEQVLKAEANGEPSTPLKNLQAAIARVTDISESAGDDAEEAAASEPEETTAEA